MRTPTGRPCGRPRVHDYALIDRLILDERLNGRLRYRTVAERYTAMCGVRLTAETLRSILKRRRAAAERVG